MRCIFLQGLKILKKGLPQNFEVYVMLSLSKHDIHFKIQKIINFDRPACRQRQAQFDNLLNFKTASFRFYLIINPGLRFMDWCYHPHLISVFT